MAGRREIDDGQAAMRERDTRLGIDSKFRDRRGRDARDCRPLQSHCAQAVRARRLQDSKRRQCRTLSGPKIQMGPHEVEHCLAPAHALDNKEFVASRSYVIGEMDLRIEPINR